MSTVPERRHGHEIVRQFPPPPDPLHRRLIVLCGTLAEGSFDGIRRRHTVLIRATDSQYLRLRRMAEWNRTIYEVPPDRERDVRPSLIRDERDGSIHLGDVTIAPSRRTPEPEPTEPDATPGAAEPELPAGPESW